MAIFGSTQISWSEPLFFIIRLRDRAGWTRRLLLALGVSVVMFPGIWFGSEANQNAGKRYYVVIEAKNDDQPWEAGMICSRTDIGSDKPEKRYARARVFFDQVVEAVQG